MRTLLRKGIFQVCVGVWHSIPLGYPHTLPAVDAYLQILGTKHKRRGIPREAYQPFRDVLLETLGRSFGPVWDDNLAAQWRDALDVATEKMLEGYEKDFHV